MEQSLYTAVPVEQGAVPNALNVEPVSEGTYRPVPERVVIDRQPVRTGGSDAASDIAGKTGNFQHAATALFCRG